MREQDYKPKPSRQNDPESDLDRALNSALAMLATVEARAGLEDRVLANLRAQESIEHRTWRAWGFATAILVVLIVAFAWHSSQRTRAPIAKEVVTPAEVKPVKSGSVRSPVIRSASAVRRTKLPKYQARAENPKLDQFPSPRPLSEQEKILAMYINQDPEHAALIAEARMETLRQAEAEKVRLASEDVREIGR
jgi:hypothetical protein